MKQVMWMTVALLTSTLALGCAQQAAEPEAAAPAATAKSYLVSEEPAGARGVGELRTDANVDGRVTMVGRVGGSPEPFVEGLAAFQLVDPALQPCAADEGCPTPWDYCCDPGEVAQNIATVKIVDDQGQVVATDAKELLDIQELSTVVVQGEAQRDAEGNLTVLADKVYVQAR